MSFISNVSKPSDALVKLVEAVGILLQVPISHEKSIYKASSPSNYDGTVALLLDNFSACINKLGTMKSDQVSNDVASALYSKTLEDGFDYETAVQTGGLEARDLYNCVCSVINRLNEETFRIPIKKTNVMVLADGSRPSYVALDCATHLHHHGTCIVAALQVAGSKKLNAAMIQTHLPVDLERRCRDQYKIHTDSFQIDVLQPRATSEIVDHVEETMLKNNCHILVLGIDANFTGTENLSITAAWATWKTDYIVVLVKSCSRIRPFTSTHMIRKLLICVKDIDAIDDLFVKCLSFIKPGDVVVFCSVVDNGDPCGDTRDTRFGMGTRSRWVAGAVENPHEPNRVGWNDEIVAALEARMLELLKISQIEGSTRIHRHDKTKTVAQDLCTIALEENVDMMVLRRGVHREVSMECVASSPCTIALCD
mmetsp:Transcript_20859/g.30007  ORF Transcript_20859/g.30007 Transcript_20859/m.30007 type:complete len:424 (+) Transcript_20859:134-1405(+)